MTQNFFKNKQQFFDAWALNYDFLLTTIVYQAIHKRLLEYVELPSNPTVLDLGCGTGRLLNRLGDKFHDLKGVGLDLSPKMLHQARQNNRHHPRMIYLQGNAEFLPFANHQFDGVFNTISFLHYSNPQQVFREISRVLKPHGNYYLVDTIADKLPFTQLAFSPNGIRFYTLKQREELGKSVGLDCLNHYYLIAPVVLSIFTKNFPKII